MGNGNLVSLLRRKTVKTSQNLAFSRKISRKLKKNGKISFFPLVNLSFSDILQKSLQITGDKERRRAPLANSYDAKRSEPRRHEGDVRPRFQANFGEREFHIDVL